MPGFPEDSSGIFTSLFGVVLVVVLGIGISNFNRSRSEGETPTSPSLTEVIRADQEKILKLESQIRRRESDWLQRSSPLKGHETRLAELHRASEDLGEQLASLKARLVEEQRTVRHLVQQRDQMLGQARDQVRGSQLNRTFEELQLADGRAYHDVSVRGHDEHGLRLRHRRGTSRVAYADLPDWLKEELMWSPSERVVRKRASPATTKPHPVQNKRRSAPQPDRKAQAAALEEVRRRFTRGRTIYLSSRRRAEEARANASSSSKSVPGGLQTWADRATALERETRRLSVEYHRVRRELAERSPNDPLLELEP